MKRSILILAGIISFIAASLAFITADTPKYKNLKILKKDISKPELDSIMRFFTVSLGEKCNFCHVRNEAEKTMDFASDANPNKNTARFMLRMVAKINKKYFKDREMEENKGIAAVTCYTCHRGESSPAVKPHPIRRDSMGMPGNMRPFPGDSMRNFRRDSVRNMPADSMKSQH